MASQWHYQLFGEEFGPVSEDVLRSLMSKGTLGGDDTVRQDGGSWMPVSQALNGSETVGESTATAIATMADHPDDEEGWYCQVLGQELGPLTFNDLLRFAESGELSADDQLRFGTEGKWRRVGSMGRLVAVLPYQASTSLRARPKLVAKAEKPVNPAPTAPAEPAATPAAAGSLASIPEANEQTWFAWIKGKEYGPSSLLQLEQWLKTGQLSATDFVKMGRAGEWCPPSTVTEILSHLAPLVSGASAPAAAAKPAPVAPAISPTPAPTAKPSAAAISTVTDVKAPTAAEVKVTEAPTPVVAKIEPAPAPKPAPPVTAPSTSSYGGSSTSSWSPPKTPPKPVAKPRSSSSGPSIDFSFLAPLMDAKTLGIGGGVIVAVALVIGLMYMPAGNGLEAKYFKELHGLFVEFQKVRESKGDAAQVQAIKAKSEKICPPIADALKDRASAKRPTTQKLLWVAKYRMSEMLAQGAAKRTPAEIDCEQLLYDVAQDLKLPMNKPEPIQSAEPKGPVNPNIDKGA